MMHPTLHPPPTPLRPHRRGSIYLVVLSTTLLVTSIALLGVESQRNSARSVELLISSTKARASSQSGFEVALQTLNTLPTWRNTFSSGSRVTNFIDGMGSEALVTITDPNDGDLSNDIWQDVVLKSTATHEDATQSFSVRLTPSIDPDPALSYGLFASGGISFQSVTFNSTKAVYARGNVVAQSSNVISPVGSAGTVTGATYSSVNQQGLPLERETDPSAISLWQARATPIRIADIPDRQIRNVAIGPGINPYGTKITNASGIYVIDCENGALTITNCRTVATLIIKNCTSLRFTGSLSLQSPSTSQPTLLVNGNAEIQMSNSDLNELTSLTNFNPPGAPSSSGTNLTTLDTYPSRINGLIYFTGSLNISGTSRLIGVVISGSDVTIASSVGLSYVSTYASDPPMGFRQPGALKVISGSMLQHGR
jgi:hypothetical protein